MRYAHGRGIGQSRGVIMIDLRAVRATLGAEIADLSTYEGRRIHLRDNALATSWSQRDFEVILTIPELHSTHILGYLDMADLLLPSRQLKCDETLLLANLPGLHGHNK